MEAWFTQAQDAIAQDSVIVDPLSAGNADAMAAAGVVDPKRCILLDDSVKNIQMAKQVGFVTVLVGKKSRDSGDDIVCAEADFHISKVTELADVIPGIFQSPSPL